MTTLEVARMGDHIADCVRANGDRFKSNAAHADFAQFVALRLRGEFPRFPAQTFVLACMPGWMAGARQSNIWEQRAREVAK